MKTAEGMILTGVANSYVAVPSGGVDKKFSGIIKLNETTADIYRGIEDGKTVEEIAADLVEK